MGMVWGYVFRAVLGRFGSFSVHFAHIVGARGGVGQRKGKEKSINVLAVGTLYLK